MTTSSPRPIELLAPARDADTAIEAILHGADAVYMGSTSHGARAAAANSLDDVERTVRFAHPYGAKVYVTLNTIIYPDELDRVRELVENLYRIGVDALIVQDMALLRMDIPPIALHASTQCDIDTPDKARFLSEVGFSQLVLARELTLEETAAVHRAVPDTPLEAFVHGALCVSYSGNCQAGQATARRSANRGECPQICRLPFDLTDGEGRVIIRNRHLLSLRDLNRSSAVAEMMEAGVSSFKIEGRLKEPGYVKNVTAAYRRIIDGVIAANPDKYRRSSYGASALTFEPDLSRSFNRGFTEYFTRSPRPTGGMASLLSPKWCGTEVGKVLRCTPRNITARLNCTLANGDGLGYFDTEGTFRGFRLNRAEGSTLWPASPQNIPPGTPLYRNHDKLRADMMAGRTAERTLEVSLTLRVAEDAVVIDAADERGCRISVSEPMALEPASTPQTGRRAEALRKTGGTIYRVTEIDDRAGNLFIPAKVLTALRRRALEALDRSWKARYSYDYRRRERTDARLWDGVTALTYHHNVANGLAEEFYRSHGAQTVEPALETTPRRGELTVMTTRYCLRRELGACLRNGTDGQKLPKELMLVSGRNRFSLLFDCRNCRMSVVTKAGKA